MFAVKPLGKTAGLRHAPKLVVDGETPGGRRLVGRCPGRPLRINLRAASLFGPYFGETGRGPDRLAVRSIRRRSGLYVLTGLLQGDDVLAQHAGEGVMHRGP
jgi:hypothetical protein